MPPLDTSFELLRFGPSIFGPRILLGANWGLLWWFLGAGALFIVLHAAWKALAPSKGTGAS